LLIDDKEFTDKIVEDSELRFEFKLCKLCVTLLI